MSFISNKVKNYKKKGKNIIIMGDFNEIANVSLDRWSNINCESTPSNTLIKKLTALKMIDTFRYLHPDKKKFSRSAIETHVINGVKTKKHIHTRIDYIFCSKHMAQDILSSDIVTEQIIHSDHRAVLAKINIAQKPDTPQTPEPSTFKKINTKKLLSNDKIKKRFNEDSARIFLTTPEIDYEGWQTKLLELAESTLGRQSERTNNTKVKYINYTDIIEFNKNLSILTKIYHRLRKYADFSKESLVIELANKYILPKEIKTGTSTIEKMTLVNKIESSIRNKKTHTIRRMKRSNMREGVSNIIDSINHDKNKVFKILSNSKRALGSLTAFSTGQTIITNPELVKSCISEYWAELFKAKANDHTIDTPWFCENLAPIPQTESKLNEHITVTEVKEIISKLKNNKAAGADEIYVELLKNVDDIAIIGLTKIMNTALTTKTIPASWRHSRIYPIFKGTGSEYDPSNYRPIALLSVPYKIYTTIINDRLSKILENKKILAPEQTGFRKDMDTSLNVFTLLNIINHSHANRNPLHVLYIDLTKAYDSLQIWSIEENMRYIGFDEEAVKLIISLYKDSTADVITPHGISPKFEVSSGVRQGDPLSPTIFIMCTNAITKYIRSKFQGYTAYGEKVTSLNFADDASLITSKRQEILEMFDIFQQFCNYNHLKINPGKSAYPGLMTHQ
jgi:hypothetical protein